jgi:hypothetical protein
MSCCQADGNAAKGKIYGSYGQSTHLHQKKSCFTASRQRNTAKLSLDLAQAGFPLFEYLRLKMIGIDFESPNH